MQTPSSTLSTHLTAFFPSAEVHTLQSPSLAKVDTPDHTSKKENFTLPPEFIAVLTQYNEIFIKITHFIDQYCPPAEKLKPIFNDFLMQLQEKNMGSQTIELYSTGKPHFDIFCQLLEHSDILLQEKILAVNCLAQEMATPNDKLIEHLVTIVQQLQQTFGPGKEATRQFVQMIEHWIDEFCDSLTRDALLKQHYVAAYSYFLKSYYKLPLEALTASPSLGVLGPTQADFMVCLRYIKARLTPYAIVAAMAKNYLAELHSVIPATGPGLSYEEATLRLANLKTKLTPIYGDIPNACLLWQVNSRYYPLLRDTVLQVFLLQHLQARDFTPYQIHTLYQYQTTAYQGYTPQATLPPNLGEFISICYTGPLYFVRIKNQSYPQLVTLLHLEPLLNNSTLPIPLLEEAISNTSSLEIAKRLPIWIQHASFFNAYLRSKFLTQENKLAEIIINLFNRPLLDAPLAHTTFQQLGFSEQLTRTYFRAVSLEKFFQLLATVLENLIKKSSITLINTEAVLQNLLTIGGMPANITDQQGNTLLIQAAHQGWINSLDALRWRGVDINAVNSHHLTALMCAAAKGHIEAVRKLCGAGANLNIKSRAKKSAFTYAVINKQLPVVAFLLEFQRPRATLKSSFSDVEMNAPDSEGMTPLLRLFQAQDTDIQGSEPTPAIFQAILKLLLQHNADIYVRDLKGFSVLAYEKTLTTGCFDTLLEAGANPFGQDASTILFNVIKHNPSAILTLLRMGTPIHTTQDLQNGYCLINEMIHQENWPMAKLLLQYGQETFIPFFRFRALYTITKQMVTENLSKTEGKPLVRDMLNPTFFYPNNIAQPNCFEGLLQFLLTYQDELETKHLLAMLTLLIIKKIDLCLPMNNGDTLLTCFVRHGFSTHKIFSPLLAHLAKHTDLLNRMNQEGDTPFTKAIQTSDLQAMEIFLQINPAIIHTQDGQGRTPFQLAVQHQQGVAMNWLMVKGAAITFS
jgi:ankyrin repeat protein